MNNVCVCFAVVFYNFDFYFFSLFFWFISCLRNFVEVLILLSCCFYAPRRGDLVRSAAKSSAFSVIYFATREKTKRKRQSSKEEPEEEDELKKSC